MKQYEENENIYDTEEEQSEEYDKYDSDDWRYRNYEENGFEADNGTYWAERRYDKADSALEKEMLRQEKKASRASDKIWKKHRTPEGIVKDVSGYNKRQQRRASNGSIIENLGYRPEDRYKPTTTDRLLNKYCTSGQRMGIYIAVSVIAVVMIALKLFGVL